MSVIGVTSKAGSTTYAAVIIADRAVREKDGSASLYTKYGDLEIFVGRVFPDHMEPDSDLDALLLAAEENK